MFSGMREFMSWDVWYTRWFGFVVSGTAIAYTFIADVMTFRT